MDGIRLVEITDELSIVNHDHWDGMVEYKPSVKYRFEQENPLDPTDILRFGKYHIDEFKCTFVVSPSEYSSLLNFLRTVNLFDKRIGTGLYIQYDHNGSSISYPITSIKNLPKASDDLTEFDDNIEITLESRYVNNPGLPTFTNYSAGNYGDALYNW